MNEQGHRTMGAVNRREFLKTMAMGAVALTGAPALLSACSSLQGADLEGPPPHIIVIAVDTLTAACLSCYGSPQYHTPHIDQLAAKGLRFGHYYSHPTSSTVQEQLLSGQYPSQRGFTGWGFTPCIAPAVTVSQALKTKGYYTGAFGKWQGVYDPAYYGFDDYAYVAKTVQQGMPKAAQADPALAEIYKDFEQYNQKGRFNPYRQVLLFSSHQQQPSVIDSSHYSPDIMAERVAQFITSRAKEPQPFFLYYPMSLAGEPFHLPPGVSKRGGLSNYAHMLNTMDRLVGQLMAQVNQLGLDSQTVILFTSAGGTPSKLMPWLAQNPEADHMLSEGRTHAPLIVRWPGRIYPNVTDVLSDVADIYPTLIELAGQPIHQRHREKLALLGQSLLPVFTGRSSTGRPWVRAEYKGQGWVRNHQWKLNDTDELFELNQGAAQRVSLQRIQDNPNVLSSYQQLHQAVEHVHAMSWKAGLVKLPEITIERR